MEVRSSISNGNCTVKGWQFKNEDGGHYSGTDDASKLSNILLFMVCLFISKRNFVTLTHHAPFTKLIDYLYVPYLVFFSNFTTFYSIVNLTLLVQSPTNEESYKSFR